MLITYNNNSRYLPYVLELNFGHNVQQYIILVLNNILLQILF